jgi:hypothetical protein
MSNPDSTPTPEDTSHFKNFISSTYKPDCLEVIEEIKDKKERHNGMDYTGIYIKTNLQEMHFLIDNHHGCCESFDVELHGCEEKDLIGDIVKTVRWSINKKEFVPSYFEVENDESYESDKYYNGVAVCIETNNRNVFIEIYNIHNGYYPHSYKVKWGEYQDEENL